MPHSTIVKKVIILWLKDSRQQSWKIHVIHLATASFSCLQPPQGLVLVTSLWPVILGDLPWFVAGLPNFLHFHSLISFGSGTTMLLQPLPGNYSETIVQIRQDLKTEEVKELLSDMKLMDRIYWAWCLKEENNNETPLQKPHSSHPKRCVENVLQWKNEPQPSTIFIYQLFPQNSL